MFFADWKLFINIVNFAYWRASIIKQAWVSLLNVLGFGHVAEPQSLQEKVESKKQRASARYCKLSSLKRGRLIGDLNLNFGTTRLVVKIVILFRIVSRGAKASIDIPTIFPMFCTPIVIPFS